MAQQATGSSDAEWQAGGDSQRSLCVVIPPACNPTMPSLGVAQLSGYLSAHGIHCQTIDLNREFYSYVLSSAFVCEQLELLEHRMRDLEEHQATTLKGQAAYLELLKAKVLGNQYNAWLQGESASCGSSGVPLEHVLRASHLAFPLLSCSWPDYALTTDGITSKVDPRDHLQVVRAAWHTCNPFQAFYCQRRIADRLRAGKPAAIGVSVSYLSQLLPSIALVATLHASGFSVPVILGGALFESFADFVDGDDPLFQRVFAVVVGPGESVLQAIGTEGPELALSRLPEAAISHGQRTRVVEMRCLSDRDVRPVAFPDFRHLPEADRTDHPQILPFMWRGRCYWGKCAFCVQQHDRYGRDREIPDCAAAVVALRRRYGSEWFYFLDAAVTPEDLRDIAASLQALEFDAKWIMNARFGAALAEEEFCRQLFASGCRMLRFGLESGSQSVLTTMRKGLSLELAEKVLQRCSSAGIHTHAYIMFGFPGETDADRDQTLRFALRNFDYIGSVSCSHFTPCRGSSVYHMPRHYGVTIDDRAVSSRCWCEPELSGLPSRDAASCGRYAQKMAQLFLRKRSTHTLDRADDETLSALFGWRTRLSSPHAKQICPHCVLHVRSGRLVTAANLPKVVKSLTEGPCNAVDVSFPPGFCSPRQDLHLTYQQGGCDSRSSGPWVFYACDGNRIGILSSEGAAILQAIADTPRSAEDVYRLQSCIGRSRLDALLVSLARHGVIERAYCEAHDEAMIGGETNDIAYLNVEPFESVA